MKLFLNIRFILFVGMIVFFTSCADDPAIENPEELITTVQLTFYNNTDTAIFEFKDLDGDGGNAPIYLTDTLLDSTMYTLSIKLLDESVSPADNIHEEVLEEADEHQFFFLSTENLGIQYADEDANGLPIGLTTTFDGFPNGTTTLTVVLRHSPDKNAAGVPQGDITNAGGDTDIEVDFEVVAQ